MKSTIKLPPLPMERQGWPDDHGSPAEVGLSNRPPYVLSLEPQPYSDSALRRVVPQGVSWVSRKRGVCPGHLVFSVPSRWQSSYWAPGLPGRKVLPLTRVRRPGCYFLTRSTDAVAGHRASGTGSTNAAGESPGPPPALSPECGGRRSMPSIADSPHILAPDAVARPDAQDLAAAVSQHGVGTLVYGADEKPVYLAFGYLISLQPTAQRLRGLVPHGHGTRSSPA